MTISAIAKVLGRSRTVVSKYARCSLSQTRHKKRAPRASLLDRRSKVVKLAGLLTSREGRSFATYGSTRQIRSALHRTYGIKVSARTISRDLRGAGWRNLVRRNTPTRNTKEIAERFAFCKRWKNVQPRNIVFSDECWITGIEETGRTQWCAPGVRPLPIERKCRFNVPSFMVWGAIGVGWRSPLIILPKKAKNEDGAYGSVPRGWTMNSRAYIKRCLSRVAKSLKASGRWFQQDGAKCHDNNNVRQYCCRMGVKLLRPWPASSPDYSPIENYWHTLKMAIGAQCPMNDKELKSAAQTAWDNMPQSVIDNHVKSFRKKMLDGYQKKGK